MKIEVDLKDLIETIVDMTVEHYVDEYETSDRQTHKKIVDDNIESMKNVLTTKIISIVGEGKNIEHYDEDKAYTKKAEDCTVKELIQYLKSAPEFTHIAIYKDDLLFMADDLKICHARPDNDIILNAK